MKKADIAKLLQAYKDGTLSEEEAVDKIAETPFEEMQFAAIDHHRELRQGMPEVIYAAGKTPGGSTTKRCWKKYPKQNMMK